MESLRLAHLIFVSAWGGLVLGEALMELSAKDGVSRQQAAGFHYWMDIFGELPLIAGTLTTGIFLARRSWPPTGLLALKITAALAAAGLNLFCVGVVIRRYRRRGDALELERQGRFVRLSGYAGIPLATVAAYLGLAYFHP